MKNVLIFIFCFYVSLLSAQTLTIEEQKELKEIRKTNDSVFVTVEQMPQFRGGETEMFKFVLDNIKYPSINKDELPVTRAIVRFIVTKTGKIEDVQAIRYNIDSELAKNLVKVIESMPDWYAGKNNGQPVDVYYTFPLHVDYK